MHPASGLGAALRSALTVKDVGTYCFSPLFWFSRYSHQYTVSSLLLSTEIAKLYQLLPLMVFRRISCSDLHVVSNHIIGSQACALFLKSCKVLGRLYNWTGAWFFSSVKWGW